VAYESLTLHHFFFATLTNT